jgi:hypothetical protein
MQIVFSSSSSSFKTIVCTYAAILPLALKQHAGFAWESFLKVKAKTSRQTLLLVRDN